MNINIKKITFLFLTVMFFTFPYDLSASFSVSPHIIDDSGLPGDSVSETITLKNKKDSRLNVFVTVNNVSFDEDGGIEDFEIKRGLDKADSLANWVSITRAPLELDPGESMDIPITVSIDPNAKEGNYHAYVFFGEGFLRSEAESNVSRDRATLLSINVGDDSEEILQLVEFSPESQYMSGSPINFNIELENRGETVLTPRGEMIIYNKNGRESGSVDINPKLLSVDPGESISLPVEWDGDLDWGRQRSRISISYGSKGNRMVIEDSTFFTILPIIPLTVIFVVLLSFIIFLINLIHKNQEKNFSQNASYKRRVRSESLKDQDENTIDLR